MDAIATSIRRPLIAPLVCNLVIGFVFTLFATVSRSTTVAPVTEPSVAPTTTPTTVPTTSENWPRWRGPDDNGNLPLADADYHGDGHRYATHFDANTGLLWKITLPGKGCSTPIVWNHTIYLTAPQDGRDAAMALDWSGKTLWQTVLGAERKGQHRNGSGCNPSAVTDGQNLFVYFKSGTLAGLEMGTGGIRWRTNLQDKYGKDTLYWDLGTSPVLTEKDVIVAVLNHGHSYVAAFDKLTGAVHWKVAREYETKDENDHIYATPIVVKRDGKEQILVWGAEHVTAHDAADGSVIWSVGGFNAKQTQNWVVVASPAVAGDMLIIPYGRGSELHGVRIGGKGDVTATNHIWERKDTGSFVPTPAASGGHVYLLRDRGEVECILSETGKTEWSGKFPKSNQSYYASPTVAKQFLYAAREDGIVMVARVVGGPCSDPNPFRIEAMNDMGERLVASPVPIEGRLLIRGETHLFCVAEDGK